MLRVECPGCGKKVRGGDDWSGRSGNCPKCGAVILFPHLDSEFDRAEIAARESGQSFASKVADVLEFPNLGKLKFIVVIGATGVSLWVWSYVIVILAYGRIAYNFFGLRISQLTRHGIYLNNGDELNWFWNMIFMLGYLGLWFLLVEGGRQIGRPCETKAVGMELHFARERRDVVQCLAPGPIRGETHWFGDERPADSQLFFGAAGCRDSGGADVLADEAVARTGLEFLATNTG